ncbi:MAG: hypothetical protein U1F43_30505 [Myxococcota bacterium]
MRRRRPAPSAPSSSSCRADFSCDAGLACGGDGGAAPTVRAARLGCGPPRGGASQRRKPCANDGKCQSHACAQGTLGCGCFGDFTCTPPGDGSLLVCQQGVCAQADCVPGAEGCGCLAAGACGAGLSCQAGRCLAAGCQPGDLGCGCAAGTCNTGGTCDNAICVEVTGHSEGPCYANRTCIDGNRCNLATNTCVACAPGSAACSCLGNGTCLDGLVCAAGHCIAESGQVDELRNTLDTCFSPCTESVQLGDGTYIPCSSDGLMEHCLDGTSCVQGSCVPVGDGPRTCANDLECPSYEACISGQCHSECNYDSECADGLRCHAKVCRQPCLASQAACPTGNACVTVDGEAGYCMPGPEPTGDPVTTVDGTLEVTHTVRTFTNTQVRSAFTIINNSPRNADVQVRFTREVHPDALGGSVVDTANPVSWMTMGLAAVPATPPASTDDGETNALATTTVPAGQHTLSFILGPGSSRVVVLDQAYNSVRPLWDGDLVVSANSFGSQAISLHFRGLPDGQWNGHIYYFANFRDSQINAWKANKSNAALAADTQNAFIAGWTRFRTGAITLDELKAMLDATVHETWNHPSVKNVCSRTSGNGIAGAGRPNGACYLYDNALGFSVYSEDVNQLQVPSGAVELPFSMNIKPVTAGSLQYSGRINSDTALQYAGLPKVDLKFGTNPASPVCAGGNCRADITGFDSTITVGARYASTAADPNCTSTPAGSYDLTAIPWFVMGFLRDTVFDPTVALNFRTDCRDQKFPFADQPAVNANLAGANPIPDGRRRVRHIELLDGMLVDQADMILLVREWFEPFVGDAPVPGAPPDIAAYAIIRLARNNKTLDAADYVGNAVVDTSTPAFTPGLSKQCSEDLIEEVLGRPMDPVDPVTDAAVIANALITGVAEAPAANSHLTWSGSSLSDTQVHYYCEDTGTFDQGPASSTAYPIPCPVGSRVTYFTTRGITQQTIDNLDCQRGVAIEFLPTSLGGANGAVAVASQQATFKVTARASCQDTLNIWTANHRYELGLDPRWQCEDPDDPGMPTPNSVLCDSVRLDPDADYDLRVGKLFYPPSEASVPFVPIDSAIADAFRYRVRFRSALGRPVGFVPSMCQPGSDLEPYCYDPAAIDEIGDRVDCLLDLYTTYYPKNGFGLDLATVTLIQNYLTTHFSYVTAPERCVQMGGTNDECKVLDPLLTYDGFERHFAELHIMLGDDAFTDALASRFDLAGVSVGTFKGSLLEPDGINLSGGAGYQMVLLYRATQYYERVLDRFYNLSPYLWKAGAPEGRYVTPGTVTSYMNRVALASTKLSRVWNEIARRYQGFNRPDLARRVIERGYTRAYLESIALTRMMQRIIATAPAADRAQVQQAIDETQRRYRIAMLDMADAYADITNDINFFGFTADYIPFPGLRPNDVSAVHVLLDRAKASVARAASQENEALQSTRSFDTDTAQFQAELTRVANTYEDQLAEICGTFTGTDDKVHPAISRYVDLLDAAKTQASLPPVILDPCGLVQSGQIYETRLKLEQSNLAADALTKNVDDTLGEIDAVKQQVETRCQINNALASFEYQEAGRTITLEDSIRAARTNISTFQRVQANAQADSQLAVSTFQACYPDITVSTAGLASGVSTTWSPTKCTFALANAAAASDSQATVTTQITVSENTVNGLESQISQIQRDMAFKRSQSECQFASLEASGQIRGLWTKLSELRIQMLQQQYDTEITMAQLRGLRNRAARLNDQQSDAQQVLINVEAAKNDPNVRIYQNAAVIRADRSFYDALREVYRVTRVYEYYTSQSYAQKEKLFIVRMIAHGEDNLEDYLTDLENSFFDFEEQFGVPATRVAVISLRDDILQIPRYGDDLTPLSQSDRIELLRQRLSSNDLIDRFGYTAIPFSTALDELSPLTRNHKVLYVGGRTHRQRRRRTGQRLPPPARHRHGARRERRQAVLAFPEIVAVLNPFFNGQRVFNPEIYRNDRLRDRPFANTHWELVLNQLDESVNKDINLNSLTDVRVYVYYTDFTEL